MWGVFAKLIGRFAVEPIKDKKMPVQEPKISKIPLKDNQYYQSLKEIEDDIKKMKKSSVILMKNLPT